MTNAKSRLWGDLDRVRRRRWLWVGAAAFMLCAGVFALIGFGGSADHVAIGIIFLIQSAGWSLQAAAGFRHRTSPPSVATAAHREPGWEQLGLGQPLDTTSADETDGTGRRV